MTTAKGCVAFLHWALPRIGLTWNGYRRVYRQVCKRVGRRVQALGLGDMAGYREYLNSHPAEWRQVETACLIPISRFFRDRAVFDRLGIEVLPKLADQAAARARHVIRAWSIGCASGEEPYSLSILWHLGPAKLFPGVSLEIVATDIAPHMIARAQLGCYRKGSLREVPREWLDIAFVERDGLFCVRDRFRENIAFMQADLTGPLPEGPFDLILCRNVAFTYFSADRQRTELDRLCTTMSDGGYLVIGRKESLPETTAGLTALDDAGPIYRLTRHA